MAYRVMVVVQDDSSDAPWNVQDYRTVLETEDRLDAVTLMSVIGDSFIGEVE